MRLKDVVLKLTPLDRCEQLCSDPAQGFVILGTQMIETVLVSKLMNQKPHDIVVDAALEPVSAEAEFVENEFSAWAIGRSP